VVYLFSPNFPCNPDPPIPARLCPSLVRLEDLVPLLVRLVLIFLYLINPLLAILVHKGALPAFNPLAIPFPLKGCLDCLLSIIKTKDR
jgi:hypothetical protein